MKIALSSSIVLLALGCAQPTVAAEKLPAPAKKLAKSASKTTAVFGMGCFWCAEAVFEVLDGVTDVVSGYAGGTSADADYKVVSAGRTKHAEVVKVTFDPKKISYETLLHVLFSTHDPTTKDRQGPDHGPQYRSAIFYADDAEKAVARAYIDQLNAKNLFNGRIVTTLEPLTKFHAAEKYHQDFVRLHPNHGYVRQWALPKVAKVKKLFPGQLGK